MEFPSLGEQCSNEQCKQLDFIPLKCQCSLYFCRNHFMDHCLSGECKACPNLKDKPLISSNSIIYKCVTDGCKRASLVEMPCDVCNVHFCIEHRFHKPCYDLNSETILMQRREIEEEDRRNEKTRQMIEAEVTERLRKAEQSSRAKTALKILLMKLKQKATGEKSVSTGDRMYFAVKRPLDNNPKVLQTTPKDISNIKYDFADSSVKAVYVSKNWSIGRSIDSIATTCGIKNENHLPKSAKLKLFRESDGLCVGMFEMELTMKYFLDNNVLIDGERINFDYISTENTTSLDKNVAYFLN